MQSCHSSVVLDGFMYSINITNNELDARNVRVRKGLQFWMHTTHCYSYKRNSLTLLLQKNCFYHMVGCYIVECVRVHWARRNLIHQDL